MKRVKKLLFCFIAIAGLSLAPTTQTNAQIIDLILEAVKAAIKAADLKVQQLQNGVITLQDAEKQVENDLSKLKLDQIGDWVEKQKDLYSEYFDELWKVKTVIAYYDRITKIIDAQTNLVSEYRSDFAQTQKDTHFSASELTYIYNVYSGIIDESIKNVDQLTTLLKSFTVQMSDGERLKLLDRTADGIEKQITDLRTFTNQNIQLSLQRAKDLGDLNTIKKLYGL